MDDFTIKAGLPANVKNKNKLPNTHHLYKALCKDVTYVLLSLSLTESGLPNTCQIQPNTTKSLHCR